MPRHSKKKYIGADLQLTTSRGERFGRENVEDEKYVPMKERRSKKFRADSDFVIQARVPKQRGPGPAGPPYTGKHDTIPPSLRAEIDDANDQFSRNRPYPLDYICLFLRIFWSSLLIKQTRENALQANRRKWKRLPPITDSIGILSLLKLLVIPRGYSTDDLIAYTNRLIEDESKVTDLRRQMPDEYKYLVPHFKKRRVKLNAAQRKRRDALNGANGEHTGVDDHDPLGEILNTIRRDHSTSDPNSLVRIEFFSESGRFRCHITYGGETGVGYGISKKVAKACAATLLLRLLDQLNGANGEHTGSDDVDCNICYRPLTRNVVPGRRKPNNYLFNLGGCNRQCAANMCIGCCAETYAANLTNNLDSAVHIIKCPLLSL